MAVACCAAAGCAAAFCWAEPATAPDTAVAVPTTTASRCGSDQAWTPRSYSSHKVSPCVLEKTCIAQAAAILLGLTGPGHAVCHNEAITRLGPLRCFEDYGEVFLQLRFLSALKFECSSSTENALEGLGDAVLYRTAGEQEERRRTLGHLCALP